MDIMTTVILTLAALLALPTAPSSPRELVATLMRADNASDLEAALALYADDAVLLPPNEVAVEGKAAIRARYTRLFASTRMDARFEVDEDRVDGDLGVVRGRMVGRRLVAAGSQVEDLTGKFVMLLRQRSDGWAITTLIWNPDR